MMLTSEVSRRAACTGHLDVVDAAFDTGGSAHTAAMDKLRVLCAHCPIWDECLRDALDNGEHGPWGGTVERQRNKVTGTRPFRFNMRNVEYEYVTSAEPSQRLYGNPETREIKEWAVEQGLLEAITRGSVRRTIREAYYAAHQPA